MRGLWVVLGSIGLLAIAYAGDRWLWTISINAGAFAGDGGWRELGHVVSLLTRLVMLGGLVAVFLALRGPAGRRASWALLGLGALVGIVPGVLVGLQFALAPIAEPFIRLDATTDPIVGGRAVLLPWTATGLGVVGLVRAIDFGGRRPAQAIGPIALVVGAALAFAAGYGLDALHEGAAIALASTLDGYPLYVIAGTGARIAVMVAFALLLVVLAGRAPSRAAGAALGAIGFVGFVVLPVLGLQAPAFPRLGSESLAAMLDPGTGGRWMAGAILAAGVVELVRTWGLAAADPVPTPAFARGHEPA